MPGDDLPWCRRRTTWQVRDGARLLLKVAMWGEATAPTPTPERALSLEVQGTGADPRNCWSPDTGRKRAFERRGVIDGPEQAYLPVPERGTYRPSYSQHGHPEAGYPRRER